MKIKEYLKDNFLIFDGAMGTYFSSLYDNPLYKCEYANITNPNFIKDIHKQYLEAGAKAIKTNTFNLEKDGQFSIEEIIKKGYLLATDVARDYNAFVFADIGYIPTKNTENKLELYKNIVDIFLKEGAKNFLFETLADDEGISEIIDYIKKKEKEAYIIVSFAIDVEGFTSKGELGATLFSKYMNNKNADSVGFNCVCGPMHLNKIISTLNLKGKEISIMPNSGYPTIIGNRTTYGNNPTYYANQILEIAKKNVKIIGGCCGTTPEYIKEIKAKIYGIEIVQEENIKKEEEIAEKSKTRNRFYEKLINNEKPIAVELDSPLFDNVEKFMKNAKELKDVGVDMLTIADCPIARARMDSSLLACKVKRELDIDVMPHLTCRDRNINASKALLLGMSVEEIRNVLIITGDPVPSAFRNEVKTVFEFNSRMLIKYIKNLNETVFLSPFKLYAALNINAKNFFKQLELAKIKEENGAVGFFTQPVLSERALENLKLAKEYLKTPIVVGIMPVLSYKNGEFMNNEIPGIEVSEEILNLYINKNKEECTELAVDISCKMLDKCRPYANGFYIITLFGRVDIVSRIVKHK